MANLKRALRVVLADDHHFFREGLGAMLAAERLKVVGEASDGADAIAQTRELMPDIVVIDIKMLAGTRLAVVREIAAASPGVQVLALTASSDERTALETLSAGACSYLLKDTRVEELADAIRLSAAGHTVLSREVARALVANVRFNYRTGEPRRDGAPRLTVREREVMRLIADGLDNATIGRELSISRHTVKQHVTHIFQKLGVQGRVQAAVYAVRQGLV